MRTEAEKQSAAETGATGMKAAAETGNEGGEAHKPMGRKEEALEGRDGRKRGASAALDVDSPSNSSHHSRKRV